MHDISLLKDLIIILSVALLILLVFHKLKLPSIAGFIFAGLLVGPQGLKLIGDIGEIEALAEIGIALLLFGIGAELHLGKLKRLWKYALVGGFIQVTLTVAAAFGISRYFGISHVNSILIGFIVALSSTAIVLRGLQQRGEVDSPHGRIILGILVFQDFCVIPMMMAIPIFLGADFGFGAIALTLLKSSVIIGVVVTLAVIVVPRALKAVARTRQRQLFILSIFVICLGTAWLVTKSGASLAIGAFLAGLVVAGSEYRHQAMADMLAFKEVFTSLFFISIGMILNPAAIYNNFGTILLVLAGVLAGKAIIVFVTALTLKLTIRVSLLAGFALAQVGEFSFVLLYAVKKTAVISSQIETSLVSAAILSMFITPFALSFSPRVAAGLGRWLPLKNLLNRPENKENEYNIAKMVGHVIIAGYGFAGKELTDCLAKCGVPFVIIDINIENINAALNDGKNAIFGDIANDTVLEYAGIERASEIVILINDPKAAEHAVKTSRAFSTDLFIAVRVNYLLDINQLVEAGADEVISAEREAAARVAGQVLDRHKVEKTEIGRSLSSIRRQTEDDK